MDTNTKQALKTVSLRFNGDSFQQKKPDGDRLPSPCLLEHFLTILGVQLRVESNSTVALESMLPGGMDVLGSHLATVCYRMSKSTPVSEEALQRQVCEEHSKLLKVYQQSVSKYSTTLNALEEARPNTLKEEYQRMAGYVEQARLNSDQARSELDSHVTEHGC
jgi:hypothetical protein